MNSPQTSSLTNLKNNFFTPSNVRDLRVSTRVLNIILILGMGYFAVDLIYTTSVVTSKMSDSGNSFAFYALWFYGLFNVLAYLLGAYCAYRKMNFGYVLFPALLAYAFFSLLMKGSQGLPVIVILLSFLMQSIFSVISYLLLKRLFSHKKT